MRFTTTLALAFAATAYGQNYLGFNSGATKADRSAKFKADFEAEFRTAKNLENAPGDFSAVRLYTNIQAYSEDDPIQAFEAAIETDTKILLGVWASGTDNIDKEISALKKAVQQYGNKLTDLVIGISIGSEDLYRISATGVENESGVGQSPTVLVEFIQDFKDAFADSSLANIPVGHVDTWDVWGNITNKPVIDAIDFLGVDEYPYYENGKGNSIENAGRLFDRAYDATVAASQGKPVWVTETGWPYIGPDWDQAVSSVDNAETYWKEIGCKRLFNKTPTFWYTLRDSNPDNKMKFAITEDLSTKPLFDLSCDDVEDEPTSTKSSGASSTKSAGTASGTATGSSKPTGSANSTATGSLKPTGSANSTATGSSKPTGTASGTATGSSAPTGTSSVGSSGTATPTGATSTGSGDTTSPTGGSGSGSGSDDSEAGSGSGSGSESGSGSGSGSNSGSSGAGSDAGSSEGSGSGSGPEVVQGAASAPMFSAAVCAGLALVAGVSALL
ncbi:hypothetical protein DL768_006667 [Monosporascus sp. mg162]|nr:hypothetical protein DL768_006667 [Monosporascus sp. mg162]